VNCAAQDSGERNSDKEERDRTSDVCTGRRTKFCQTDVE